jgi:tetratricopeptide (TPR) repeat protein
MGQPPDRRLLIRWAFLGMGYLLLFGNNFVVRRLLLTDFWGTWLFGRYSAFYAFLMAAAYFYLIPTSLLCFATAWALKRYKVWGRWTGIVACSASLPWFPVMTLLGALGIYFLATLPNGSPAATDKIRQAAARRSKDYWTAKAQSKLQAVIAVLSGVASLYLLGLAQLWAVRQGMPRARWGMGFWICFVVLAFLHVVIHELAHAAMAWAFYYRIRVLSMGPFTVSHDRYGVHWQLDWNRLFETDGYTSAVATSNEHARWKHIAVIAAGPVASFLTGAAFAVIAAAVRGTSWQPYWWIPATGAVIGVTGGVFNLIPVGRSDGSMLWHLALWTAAGRILLASQFLVAEEENALRAHDRADFEKEIEIKRRMLERAQEAGSSNSMMIAASHATLGLALLSAEDWPAAESELARALGFEAELAANPGLAAAVWTALVLVRARRQRILQTGQAYAAAVGLLRLRKQAPGRVQRGWACAALAEVHAYTTNWTDAIQESTEGFKFLRLKPETLILYANLFTAQAEAYLQSGQLDRGLGAATSALETLRSSAMPAEKRNIAARELAALGEALWRAGQPSWSIEYTREAVQRMEEGGAVTAAAAHRIKLCAALRTLGRFSEAVKSLPSSEDGLPPCLRRKLLAEVIELGILAEAGREAVAHCNTLIDLWREEPVDCTLEIAAAESLLARAQLTAGDPEAAEATARHAVETLKPVGHIEAVRCLLTIAAARHKLTGAWPPEILDKARALIESAVLLPPAEKSRWLALPELKQVGSAAVALALEVRS